MSMSEVTPDGAAPSPAPSEVMTYRQQTVLLAPGPVETLEQPKNLVLIGSILTVVGVALLGTALFGSAIMMTVRIVLALVALGFPLQGSRQTRYVQVGQSVRSLVLVGVHLAGRADPGRDLRAAAAASVSTRTRSRPWPSRASPRRACSPIIRWVPTTSVFDLLARALFGARASLTVAICAVLIGMIIGGTIGVMAGYFRGKVDAVVGILTQLAAGHSFSGAAHRTGRGYSRRTCATSPSHCRFSAFPAWFESPGQTPSSSPNGSSCLPREPWAPPNGAVIWRELVPNVLVPVAALGLVAVSGLIVARKHH